MWHIARRTAPTQNTHMPPSNDPILFEDALGGEFEIQDPRGVAPAIYAPLLAFAMQGSQSVGASELISPKAGALIVFPAWLSHGVRPYTGAATRISIALNLSV